MRHVRSYLTSRVVATGAAVALLGGGAAVASDTVQPMDAEEEPIEVPAEPESTDGDVSDAEVSAGDEADQAITPDGSEGDERSDRARAVHEALTEGQEVREPGPGFGAAVSANARERRGPPDHAGGPPDHAGGPPDRDGDRPAPPSNADDPERVGPPDHAPAHGRRGQD